MVAGAPAKITLINYEPSQVSTVSPRHWAGGKCVSSGEV